MFFVCVLIHAQTAVLKTSAELYCSFSNTKLQNGDGGGPHDDYKKKQARNEGCGSSFLFLLLKNRSFFHLSVKRIIRGINFVRFTKKKHVQ